ncbi:hypothetical protein B0T26DRAFT_721217 [Lasiosphaeria miniovina]|uniref:Uncharacterized protein n=1 Tax=Lasiosphaeria miniovina TaxID=1954250 RepID=A0AA40A552_9PEZI|nr:uncharacterized protein B0T26DRAFT_721217 [Lasiosphaeria miniovina]KAK0709336.1 hypothetical protein B0T26DRAFT_721217 [Lasiosphaeria miniovina]
MYGGYSGTVEGAGGDGAVKLDSEGAVGEDGASNGAPTGRMRRWGFGSALQRLSQARRRVWLWLCGKE